jgi:hypothetical protein
VLLEFNKIVQDGQRSKVIEYLIIKFIELKKKERNPQFLPKETENTSDKRGVSNV